MPRVPRIDFAGARHHLMNRGARRSAIFGEPWMCALFLDVLAELPERFGIRLLAYAVMPPHVRGQVDHSKQIPIFSAFTRPGP